MRTRFPVDRSARPRIAGLLLAVLAFVSQLALGSVLLPDESDARALSRLAALTVICQADLPASTQQNQPHRHHPDNNVVCPLVASLALPDVLPAPEPFFPPPASAVLHRFAALQTARGPPSRTVGAGLPRGPPVLS